MSAPSPTAKTAAADNRSKILDATLRRSQQQPDALIEVLHKAQELYGYLSPELMLRVARALRVPPSRVYGVATFYHVFSLAQLGEHTCTVCLGTACYVKGAAALLAAIEGATGVRAGHTAEDGRLSVLTARCLGACGIAPAVVIDGAVAGQQAPEALAARLLDLLER